MRKVWVEMREVQVGDHLYIRQQEMVVLEIKTSRGDVCFIGETLDGRKTVYAGVDEESVQSIPQREEVHG